MVEGYVTAGKRIMAVQRELGIRTDFKDSIKEGSGRSLKCLGWTLEDAQKVAAQFAARGFNTKVNGTPESIGPYGNVGNNWRVHVWI